MRSKWKSDERLNFVVRLSGIRTTNDDQPHPRQFIVLSHERFQMYEQVIARQEFQNTSPMATAPSRTPMVRLGMEQLEKLVSGLDDSIARLHSAIGPVLYQPPTPATATLKPDAIPGSDLGQALLRLCERIETTIRTVEHITRSADL